MLYCPYCGVQTKEEETYCIKCGKLLPEDRYNRLGNKPSFFKRWKLPLLSSALLLILGIAFYVTLEIRTAKAKDYYIEGEQKVLSQDYLAAQALFQNALKLKDNFQHAEASLSFIDKAISIDATLKEAKQFRKEKKYAKALESLSQSEKDLQDFNGEAVDQMVERITKEQNTIKLEKLKHALQQEPDIDQLKILLWDATSIETAEAEQLSANIREQIVSFVFAKASDHLTNNQFNDANVIVKDGLKYAPDSEKLLSLQTTIDKEKAAFEAAQQNRMEQAMTTANKEQQLNKSGAIELKKIKLTSDKQGNLVVKGQVQSVATIPVNSIMIEYIIKTNKGEEILTNEVYVFPEELYPDETGNFEFTHYDINYKNVALKVEVKTITWYPE